MEYIKRTIGLLFITTSLLLSGCWGDNEDKKEVVKIGAILPESHKDLASYAKQLKKGMLLAEDIIHKENPNFHISYEDGFGSVAKSISAMNRLVDIEKVNFIIGPMFSHIAEGLSPISKRKKIILLSPTASSIKLSNAGKYFFRIYPSDSYDGVFLANFVNNNFNSKKIAIINENSSSINQIVKSFKSHLKSDVYIEESIDSNNQNNAINAVIIKIIKAKPDIIFFPGNKKFMSALLKKAKEHNIDSKFLTISTFNDEKLLEITKKSSEGVIFSTPLFDVNSKSEEMLDFVRQYKDKFNEMPDILAGYGYDAVNIAYFGVKNGLNTREITSRLLSIKNYKGVTGNTSFNVNGDVDKKLQVMTVKNGKFSKL